MELIIQGHDLKVTDQLEAFTRKKVDKLDRYLPNIYDIRIDLSHENTKRGERVGVAQITIRHERGAILRVQERHPGDIENAINEAVDNMYRRIQRFKGKRSRKGRERFTASVEELQMAEPVPNEREITQEIEALADLSVVRRKEINLAPLTEDEAIEQMELLGHNFFLFFNAGTSAINLLYKRSNGDYGILVPIIK